MAAGRAGAGGGAAARPSTTRLELDDEVELDDELEDEVVARVVDVEVDVEVELEVVDGGRQLHPPWQPMLALSQATPPPE